MRPYFRVFKLHFCNIKVLGSRLPLKRCYKLPFASLCFQRHTCFDFQPSSTMMSGSSPSSTKMTWDVSLPAGWMLRLEMRKLKHARKQKCLTYILTCRAILLSGTKNTQVNCRKSWACSLSHCMEKLWKKNSLKDILEISFILEEYHNLLMPQ